METLLMTISGAIILVLLIFFLALVWEELEDFMRNWRKTDNQRKFKKRISKGLLSSRH